MVSGALTGVGRIKHEYKRDKKKIPCHAVALGIGIRRYPHLRKKAEKVPKKILLSIPKLGRKGHQKCLDWGIISIILMKFVLHICEH